MFEKLSAVEKRFEEVNEKLCQPETVADQQLYTSLMKELKQLTPVVEKFREYRTAKQNHDGALELLESAGLDREMHDMAQEEFDETKAQMDKISEELKNSAASKGSKRR